MAGEGEVDVEDVACVELDGGVGCEACCEVCCECAGGSQSAARSDDVLKAENRGLDDAGFTGVPTSLESPIVSMSLGRVPE